MDFYRFWQARNLKIPLVRHTIAQTLFGDLCPETAAHYGNHVASVRVGIKIEIAADVGPMVERLDDHHCTRILQSFAHR